MTASTTSWVVLDPPRSFVRCLPSKMTRFTAVSNRSANAGNWRCLSIMADERRSATGLALFSFNCVSLPTFPAEAPCSNTAVSAPTLPAKAWHPWFEIFKLKDKVVLLNNHFYPDTTKPTNSSGRPILLHTCIGLKRRVCAALPLGRQQGLVLPYPWAGPLVQHKEIG